ncbi:MAG: PAS domain S-box protein, partial [Pyrinomonadaceae bacterium]
MSEFILPEYRDAFRDLHRLVMSGGSGILEFEVIGLNGGRRWLETHAAPMRDAKNEVVALLGVTRDITERKRAETKLRESEASFRSMANSMSQLAWIAKPDGFIFWYNHRWYEYTGTTQEEMEGWGWQSVHDPEVLPVVMEKWPAAIAAGTEFEMEFPIRGADGIFRLFLTRAVPLKDDQGRVVQWFGTNTDVDQLKLVQETLRSSQATLQGIIESAMDAIVSVDNEQNIVVFNSAAEKMFAFPAAEAIGKPLNRFIPQRFRPGHSEHIENFGKTNVTRRSMGSLGALYGLRSDGEEFPIEASISQIETDGKPIYTVILRDVTERKLAEENIKSLNKNLEQRVLDRTAQLESASRELESFSYSVSHDLRSPLRHIDGFTKLLVKREAAKLDTKSAHYLDVISGSVGKMGVLIDELLTFSRTTRQELKLDSVDLNLLIKDSMEMLEPARSIVWKVESLPIVEGDKTVLGIVLT